MKLFKIDAFKWQDVTLYFNVLIYLIESLHQVGFVFFSEFFPIFFSYFFQWGRYLKFYRFYLFFFKLFSLFVHFLHVSYWFHFRVFCFSFILFSLIEYFTFFIPLCPADLFYFQGLFFRLILNRINITEYHYHLCGNLLHKWEIQYYLHY